MEKSDGLTVLLDMDEVICDFVGGACKAFGFTRDQLESQRKPGEWSIEPALNRLLGERDQLLQPYGLTRTSFWRVIESSAVTFWRDLLPLPWMQQLIDTVAGVVGEDNWYIVSHPHTDICCHSGKVIWLHKYFGKDFDRFFLTPYKHMLAQPDRVLIDDKEENVAKFWKHGGRGILFPSQGNFRITEATNPVDHIIRELMQMKTEFV